MKTQRKKRGNAEVQTVDDGARTTGKDTVPLRSSSTAKGKRKTSCAGTRQAGVTPVLTHSQIAERARAIWIDRGCPPSDDEDNWHEAEAQLRRELGLDSASL